MRTAATTRIAPALPRCAPSSADRLSFFFANGGSTSRLLFAKPAALTQIDEIEHEDPHVRVESHVVITTDKDPIMSRVSGTGQLACFGLPLGERPPALVGSANKHGDVPWRSRPCLDHRDRPLALV